MVAKVHLLWLDGFGLVFAPVRSRVSTPYLEDRCATSFLLSSLLLSCSV